MRTKMLLASLLYALFVTGCGNAVSDNQNLDTAIKTDEETILMKEEGEKILNDFKLDERYKYAADYSLFPEDEEERQKIEPNTDIDNDSYFYIMRNMQNLNDTCKIAYPRLLGKNPVHFTKEDSYFMMAFPQYGGSMVPNREEYGYSMDSSENSREFSHEARINELFTYVSVYRDYNNDINEDIPLLDFTEKKDLESYADTIIDYIEILLMEEEIPLVSYRPLRDVDECSEFVLVKKEIEEVNGKESLYFEGAVTVTDGETNGIPVDMHFSGYLTLLERSKKPAFVFTIDRTLMQTRIGELKEKAYEVFSTLYEYSDEQIVNFYNIERRQL